MIATRQIRTQQVSWNREVEQAVLGAAMLDPERVIPTLLERLRADDFYWRGHQVLYQTILELFEAGQPVDLITVGNRLEERDRLSEVGGRAYLSEILSKTMGTAGIEQYAEIVLKKAVQRRLHQVSLEISDLACDGAECPPHELVAKAAEKLKLLEDRARARPSLELEEATFNFQLPYELQKTEEAIVDGLLCAGDLTLIVGHEKQRKSTLILQLCVCLATGRDFLGFRVCEPVQVLYIDTESKTKDLVKRWQGIEKVLSPAERERMIEKLTIIEARKLLAQGYKLDLESATLREILDVHRTAKVIVLDPLRVFYTGDEDKSGAVADALARLRVLAARRALIVVHHARKRPGARRDQLHLRDDHYIWSDNVRGSGAWKAHADVIFLQELREDEQLGEVLDFAVIARSFPNVAPMPLVTSEKTFAWHERLADQDSAEAQNKLKERERELLDHIKRLLAEAPFSRSGLVDRLVGAGVCKRAWAYRITNRFLQSGLLVEDAGGRVSIR